MGVSSTGGGYDSESKEIPIESFETVLFPVVPEQEEEAFEEFEAARHLTETTAVPAVENDVQRETVGQ